MAILAPSILAADFSVLAEELGKAGRAGAGLIHVDVMDGHFVPNISFGAGVMKCLLGKTSLPFDVHLMIENADLHIPDFVTENTEYITVHQEACPHLNRSLALIRASGAKPGVALNPATPLSTLECVLLDVDLVLIMSVNPGFGGQKFLASSLEKIRRLKGMREEKGLAFRIEVDGGVNLENAAELAAAGADIFVAGSALFGAENVNGWAKFFDRSQN
ncbi:MAG: ribulose-phosphate 3-epimerase [Clostridiales Family XIII bacterium]|jgi:ribulose-phosphate 3-epimerase|nr:ribulose-phosphate 3-epimerase [Clostridiales Family XIII bacterium]